MRRVEMQAAVLVLAAGAVTCGVVRYDQSQTGDYNVHLDLKNVELLAFLDDSSPSFGEYDYDYGELTLKPPAAPNTPSNSSSSEAPLLSSTEKTEDSSGAGADEEQQATSTVASTPTKPARRCGAGFYRDPAGRCRRQRRPGGIKLSGLLNQAKNKITG
ncbi:hypothetical protein GE061_017203 [Apolygus lucorum]|uniref:Uncharacterized protein n=2 Tax=Apolygus lucorum TaxID=248454 RepID=A0A8S9XBN7_APOLU|nr:hypothetical protein GE061_017203 [Apolygus lucorum]